MSNKACYMCQFFDITQAELGYSSYTPGCDFDMECHKDHWRFIAYDCTREEYAKMLETAKQDSIEVIDETISE